MSDTIFRSELFITERPYFITEKSCEVSTFGCLGKIKNICLYDCVCPCVNNITKMLQKDLVSL